MNFMRFLFVSLLLAFVAGCSSVHTIEAQFPTPLVEPIDKIAYLSLSDEFIGYEFSQDEEDRSDIRIILGQAHTNLFDSVISALFMQLSDSADNADISLVPELNTFQYSLPRETGSSFYEVWLRYRLQALNPDGSEIADWLITGYGRAYDERFELQGAGINEATEEALRDIGTQLTLGFAQQEDIEQWLTSEVEQ